MKLQDGIDFTTLNWVKQELDETLKQARQALEAYVEDPADSSLMRFCASYLHQVQGTLRMVELYGAAMVVEEMERVALALLDKQIKPQDETYAVLMRGIVQLPDYLERLQSGHKDIPIVLLPLLNDLRATRGEKLLTESVLFSPDLSARVPSDVAGAAQAMPEMQLKAEAARLRSAFQLSLLRWIRDDAPATQYERLIGVLDRLRSDCNQDMACKLWWVGAGVIECVASGSLEANAAVKLLFGKVDREIKRLVDAGEAGFRTAPPVDLIKNLLYYIAHSNGAGVHATAIRETYKLDTLLPSDKEIEHAQGSISGHNRALLDTVSVAIKDDLMRVKEALDIFLRSHDGDPADLAAQAEVLDRVGDTLGMLGLGVPRRVVLEQRGIVQEIANKTRPADETTLLDVAGALLYVEASLDDHIERLGAETPDGDAQSTGELELPKAEVRKILDALINEATTNIAQAKQDVVAFIESPWDHARVEPIPRLLEEIAGALRMLNLSEPAQLMNGIVRFVEVELLRHRRVPTAEQLDKLADALASVEYYMEATREQRSGREKILEITKQSLAALGYWPIPDDDGGGGSAPDLPRSQPPSSDVAHGSDATATAAAFAAADAHVGEFPRWGADSPAAGESGLKLDADNGEENLAEMPSIELTEESLDDYISHVGVLDDGPMTAATPEAAIDAPASFDVDVQPNVDVAPGHGLEDLIVGESVEHELHEHDLSGLRLVETQSTTTPEPKVRYVEIEEEVEEEVPDVDAGSPMSDASFSTTSSDDIDEEIREVFVEEVQDEIDNLNRSLPAWKSDVHNFEMLKPIRRSFHTLKGSGRLVGALALGEFSWKVENMLNRVLDKTIAPGPAAIAVIDNALSALPELLAALRGEGSPKIDIGAIMTVADQVAAGEEAYVRSGTSQRMKKVKRLVKRMVAVIDESADDTESSPVVDVVIDSDGGAMSHSFVDEPVELDSSLDIESAFAASDEQIAAHAGGDLDALAALGEGPLPNIDPVLFEILKSEVASHLGVIDTYLGELSTNASLPASEPLLRAVHTLNGAIAMVDIPVITHVLAPLESYIKRLRAGRQPPDAAGAQALSDSVDLIRDALIALENDSSHLPNSDELAARIAEVRDTLPEPDMMHPLFSVSAEDEATLAMEDGDEQIRTESPLLPESDSAVVQDEVPAGESEDALVAEAQTIELESSTPEATDEQTTEAEPVEEDLTAAWLRDFEHEQDAESAEVEALPAAADEESLELAQAASIEEDSVVLPETELLSFEDLAEAESVVMTHPDGDQETPIAVEAVSESDLDVPTPADTVPTVAETAAYVDEAAMDAASEPEFAAMPEFVADESAAVAQVNVIAMATLPPIPEDAQAEGTLELPDLDEDLLEIFVQEGADILDNSDSLMAKLREAPHDRNLVSGLQRDLHTLKGGARMAGLAPIGDLSHAMESLFEALIENRRVMDGNTIESLERGFDRLHGLVQRVAHHQAIAMPHHAIARFEGLVSGDLPAAESALVDENETPEIAVEPVAADSEPEVPAAKPLPRIPRPPRLPVMEEEEPQLRAPQEMIRVRSDLLDSLVNYAGEVSIYRSRLEQQISTFRFNLVEFETTVSRLREQLRKLELETEAQILSRYQREAESGESSFDPLELDRFSQLQQLSRALAESVSDLVSIQGLLDDLTRQSETLLLQQSRVSSDLQEGLMRTRMVPFDSLVPSLRRTVRQAAQEVGKRAQLKVEGAQGEMDRNLLERMKAPFEHMLRNAMAHGIESPDERSAANKPGEGTITIQVSREATEVVLRVSDDGRGMDRDAIRQKAIERGLLKPDAQLSDRDLYGFILETGFSTAEHVTQLAGRGVGMDVVHNEIKQLGGSLAIDSKRGSGSTFIIRLPFTLAVTQAILLRLGEATYAAPMSSVQGVVRIARDDLERRMNQPTPSYTYAGEEYLIYEMSQLLGMPPTRISDEAQLPLLMTRTGDQRAAVRIDAVVGSREIVVKSVGPQISSVPGIFGATIMGDGSVVMILDLAPLVRRIAAMRERVEAGEMVAAPVMPAPAPIEEARAHPLIMVVDDSITMRKVTTRVLERNDMDVITAKDGLDAVEKLQDKVPDVVLLDVEMPRMDGYELATYMKNDQRLKMVPIIMITSRTGEKHRQRALEIGVERYLGKPYQESDLLHNVQEILRLSRA